MYTFNKWLSEEFQIPSTLYHVTMIRNLPKIKKQGLKTNQKKTFKHGPYEQYSKNKIFLTGIKDVDTWKHKIAYQEFDQFDETQGVAVLTIDTTNLAVSKDQVAQNEGFLEAYYINENIPLVNIKNIELFTDEL